MNYKIAVMLLGITFGASSLFATEANVESSKDTSRNPITGTVTTKSKYKSNRKRADGSKTQKTVTETTSVKEDGTVETKVQNETKETPGNPE